MTHDYRSGKRGYGWDLAYDVADQGRTLKATGWGHGLSAGDYILLSNGPDDTRYRIGNDLRYQLDPSDMWSATLTFAPRQL